MFLLKIFVFNIKIIYDNLYFLKVHGIKIMTIFVISSPRGCYYQPDIRTIYEVDKPDILPQSVGNKPIKYWYGLKYSKWLHPL